LINSTVNKFANKLNNYYGIEPAASSYRLLKSLIPPVMQEMIEQSKNEQDTDFSLGKLLAMLSGNNNMNNLLNQLAVA
jgi:hypothetical protein